jgi:hypothetical protein
LAVLNQVKVLSDFDFVECRAAKINFHCVLLSDSFITNSSEKCLVQTFFFAHCGAIFWDNESGKVGA